VRAGRPWRGGTVAALLVLLAVIAVREVRVVKDYVALV